MAVTLLAWFEYASPFVKSSEFAGRPTEALPAASAKSLSPVSTVLLNHYFLAKMVAEALFQQALGKSSGCYGTL
jgi:hypothetical protein